MTNKRKIFNDPLYGFISIPSDFIFELIEHPYFQRLRRIKQLGLADLVYPGATHTRFHHALGAMHLMETTLKSLQAKGTLIMDVEKEAALVAILLHDIGHGPFSHVLEHTLMHEVSHEHISIYIMEKLNDEFDGRLSLAIDMFKNNYHRSFFHQLISSQLDMDRLDYLNRDSFYTGVIEGQIGADRIIKMLNVVDNHLVVEEKGILSVENFLSARRNMYWQVYLHKTSISIENMLIFCIKRAKELIKSGQTFEINKSLAYFLSNEISLSDFNKNIKNLNEFLVLDDVDIWQALKYWSQYDDEILRTLASGIISRNLFKIKIRDDDELAILKKEILLKAKKNKLNPTELSYYFKEGEISNSGYYFDASNIKILMKNYNILDISEASDLPAIKAMSNVVKKNYICYHNQLGS